MSASLFQLKTELDLHYSRLAALRTRCRTLELELDSKHSALLALESKHAAAAASTAQADANEREVVQLARLVVAERAQLAKLKDDRARLTHHIASKSTELAEQKRQIVKLKAQNDALELRCIDAERLLAEEEESLVQLAARYRTEIDAMETSVAQVEERAMLAVANETALERELSQRRAHLLAAGSKEAAAHAAEKENSALAATLAMTASVNVTDDAAYLRMLRTFRTAM